MADTDWGRVMRPFYGRNLAMEVAKQRRKSFAGFDLPSKSFDWDDDQNCFARFLLPLR